MANIPSSMSRAAGLSEALLSEAPKAPKDVAPKAKNSASFAEHLDEPQAKQVLAQAQKQTNGASRSSAQAQAQTQNRPAPTKKPAQSADSKNVNARDDRPIDRNLKKAPKPSAAATPREAQAPVRREEAKASSEAPAQTSKAETQSTKPTKSQLSGMTEKSKDTPAGKVTEEGAVLVLQADDIPTEGQAVLDATAFDAKATEGEPWQDRLEDMLMFMGIPPQTLQQDLPSLAILTGQLQNLAPESIPGTLAESPLLNDMLASADPETVIEQVKPLGLWLDEMGWSPDGLVVKDPEAFQELMNTPVSLKDVMKTFQVDVERVVTEAKILQETIPMDGAAPYIARATRLQAEAPQAALAQEQTQRPIKGAEGEAKNSGISPDLLALINGGVVAGHDQLAHAKPLEGAVKSPETISKSNTLDQLMAAMSLPTAASPDLMPKVALVQENPFQAMEMTTSETFAFTDALPVEAQTLSKGDRQAWLENIQAFQIQAEGPVSASAEKANTFTPEIMLERMSEAALVSLGDSAEGEEKGGDLHSEGETDHSPTTASGGTQKSQNTFELGTSETQKAQPNNPVQKAVFENAQMLVKEGGGAMRIDIGNQETGAIDLAVEVIDGKVEVKISAASAEARQMIAQDLPKLREFLQDQNLNLSKVEVGLSGGSQWTSSDGRNSRQESSSQNEEITALNGRLNQRSSKSYSRISSTQDLQPTAAREGGGIKVRV